MDPAENIPLPDELAAEEESPYRRRQRAVAVSRKTTSRLWRALKWSAVGVFLVLPGLYAAYRLVIFAWTSPLFQMSLDEDIVLNGSHFVTHDEIVTALERRARHGDAVEGGMNVFRMPLDQEARWIKSIPWVRSATLMRAYPHRLVVDIIERSPVAYANIGGRIKLVDAEGVLLEKPEKAAFDFPVIDGLDSATSAQDRESRLAMYQEFTRETAAEMLSSGWLVSDVDLSDPDDLKTLLVQGKETILLHFGHEEFADRLRTFLALLPEVRKTTPVIDSVDLRYRGQIVVNPELRKAVEK